MDRGDPGGEVRSVIAGLLLDLDGTLHDHGGAAASAVVTWARSLPGWDGDEAAASQRWHALEQRCYPMYERGECSFAEQRRMRVRGFSAALAGLDDAAADEAFGGYHDAYEAGWAADPDAEPLIRSALAAGLAVGVLTNGEEQQQRHKLERIGLALPGVRLFASGALGVTKPDARAFELACAGLGTVPATTLMVGDDLAKDVWGARAAGLSALHLVRDGTVADPDAVRSLAEVEEWVLTR